MRLIVLVAALAACVLNAQETPPATAAAPAPPPRPVLENKGRPILLPFACTDEDIHTAGLTCSEEEPCPVYLELSSAEGVGTRIFAAGNIHTQTYTLYSVLLSSEDAGHTWTEPIDRIRSAGLDRIQFLDAETGWISGGELFPLPQNPFLLLTNDGGKTWRQKPILNESSENRFGSVLQFVFGSKTDGGLVVDRGAESEEARYVLYETPDGGDTWQIKQESKKAITLKGPADAPPAWRVRADGPTAAFHIERREGERWVNAAAFLVRLDSCKPPK